MRVKRWHLRGKRWEKKNRRQQLAKKAHLPTGPRSGAEDLPREEGKNIAAEVFSSYKTWEMESYGWETVKSGPRLSGGVALSMCRAADPALFLYDK